MTAILVENAMGSSWSAVLAANRWVSVIRPKILSVVESCDEDSAESIESICFLVDEVLRDCSGNLNEYLKALEEVSSVLLTSVASPAVQLLVLSEVQKTALTC